MTNYDIHIHTHLSSCASREAFMEGYIKAAKELGIDTLGFADHAWDETVAGVSPWYSTQGYKRLEARREELTHIDTDGINILLGAEGEFAQLILGLGDEGRKYVDYVLIPHSHTHMKGFVLPEECIGNAKLHADYLIKSFLALCGHEKRKLYFGIVHPMNPIGEKYEYFEEIYSHISDETLFECACAAKEADIALEVNLSSLKEIPPEAGEENCYRRFFDACKRAGCCLFLGSDAHSKEALISNHTKKDSLLAKVGIKENDLTAAKHRILNA